MPDRLVISTASPQREAVTIDGMAYELATTDDLELRQSLWLSKKGARIKELLEGEHTDAELDELQDLLNKFTRIVILALPEEVFGRLRDSQKLAIVQAFSEAANQAGAGSRQSGATSSPGSSDSTVATSPAGSPSPSPQPGGTSS